MEAFEDSNCHSLSNSFSLYERYMRSFNVVEENPQENNLQGPGSGESSSSSNSAYENTDLKNAETGVNKNRHDVLIANYLTGTRHSDNTYDKNYVSSLQTTAHPDLCSKEVLTNIIRDCSSSLGENSFIDKCEHNVDLPVSSSEDTKSDNSTYPKPVVITSLITMENSNNAVDSVPMFHDVRPSETVFKLPITELSFNGTIKHVQKLKPIVDPMTALTSGVVTDNNMNSDDEPPREVLLINNSSNCDGYEEKSDRSSDVTDEKSINELSRGLEDATESTGDSQYEEFNRGKGLPSKKEESQFSFNQSSSSHEASFDSGVRSPDVFSEGEEEIEPEPVGNFWDFIKDYEAEEHLKVKKLEEVLRGVLPPPSVTMIRADVSEMLKNYYHYLPAFTNLFKTEMLDSKATETGSVVKNKPNLLDSMQAMNNESKDNMTVLKTEDVAISEKMCTKKNFNDKIRPDGVLKKNAECESGEIEWPDLLKCKYHDIHYNLTTYSERLELLAVKCRERFVGAETASSVTVFSGSLASPSSASKRKAQRIKLMQGKSPGRRLSHLARRRQAFCNAATIGERAHASTSRMVLIDKNFFPHKKLTYNSDTKGPRMKRTPGRKTPGRKTPGKKTPANTPKTGNKSSRKKAMRRLLMDPETLSQSQPCQTKRALFISPENRKSIREASSTSAAQVKSKRALFGSPSRSETKSLDGTPSDNFLKRKREVFENTPVYESKNKIPKSLSFGGDSFRSAQSSQCMERRASEVFNCRNSAELNESHRKKLLWAVTEALRVHGWRMGAPGFKEKASLLARLTRRLLSLPQHAARLAAPRNSTSETMLKLARQYVFAIIQGRTVDECFLEEQMKLSNEAKGKVSGYISVANYQQMKSQGTSSTSTLTSSQIKENTCNHASAKLDQPKGASKNILQDKLVNIDSNSNSNSEFGSVLFKSNSMPSFNDTAKMRARRQISFDNVELPKR